MLLRLKAEFRRRADLAQLDIGRLIRPDRDVLSRNVRDCGEIVEEGLVRLALLRLTFLYRDLEARDLLLQSLGPRLILGRLGLTDFLRGRVPLRLRVLSFLNRGTALFVQAQDLSQR